MRRLPIPQFDVREIYGSVIRGFGDGSFCDRLVAAQTSIVDAEACYNSLAQAGQLHSIQQSKTVNDDLTVAEMKDLYKSTMSAANGPARSFYDKIMDAAPHGTCPLCGQGKVRNMDHHLPQSKYPALVMTPINLVPSCRDCNSAKLDKAPRTINEQTIHPYFDDFTSIRWLHATVAKSDPPVLLYETRNPGNWPQFMSDRLRRHMTVFKLAATFTLYAGEELSQIATELQTLRDKGGSSAVCQELQKRAEDREQVHRNSWQTAMYHGLAESEWFCIIGLFLLKPTPNRANVA